MPKLYPEALAFCILWAALAVAGFALVDWKAGIALSVGLFLIIMPASAVILSRTSNFALERAVRWGILIIAGLVLLSVADLG
ncbi:MAG: hypothetical protein JOZ90_12575 [Alphaproteobacteria bacterium]|nr:hypothetical protein [Alphaproteobacteria bacterium]MBV9371805.1 hypothetical protein [Alphaproteobacteria bacterium]MBV9901910.1 hypothetical protein [Alphaproteobacteria bacterium]